MGINKKEPCGSFFICSHRANCRAIGHAQCKSPSPFGYSLLIKRESCRAHVGGVCEATWKLSMEELQGDYNHTAQRMKRVFACNIDYIFYLLYFCFKSIIT